MNLDIPSRIRDFSCGLFLTFQILGTFALYIKGRHHALQRSAFYFMLYLLGISLLEFFLFFIHNFIGENMVPMTDMLQTTVVPLALMLLYRLTHSRSMRWLPALINTAPYVAALLIYAICPSSFVYNGILLVAVIHSILIIIYGVFAVREVNKQLVANFSSDDNLSLRWMRLFLLFYVALAIVWLVATKSASLHVAAAYNVMCSIILGLLCYFIYRQEEMLEVLQETSLTNVVSTIEENSEDLGTSATPACSTHYHFDEVFETMFSDKKIYLNPSLNINDLARELGTNRTYVSNYINQQLHTTFYEYVNDWRVKHSISLLTSTDLTLQEVATQSGFNSISSFRRYFVTKMGQTPSAYKKSLKT